MISGAFLLHNDKNQHAIQFYKKTSYKIFLPLIPVMLMLFIIREVQLTAAGHISLAPVKGILMGNFYNLWFMYMLFGLYLLVPFIIRIKNMIGGVYYKVVSYILLLWAVISAATSSTRVPYSIGLVFQYLSYMMVGNVLYEEKLNGKLIKTALHAIIFICMVLISFAVRFIGFNDYTLDAYRSFFSPTIVIASIAIFHIFLQMDIKVDCSRLSFYTFYIYLFHTVILRSLLSIPMVVEGNELGNITIVALLTFFIALGIAWIYHKVWGIITKTLWLKEKWDKMMIWKIIDSVKIFSQI